MVGDGVAELSGLLSTGARVPTQRRSWIEALIGSTGDLVRIVECAHRGSYQYRGHADADWDLLSKLTRTGGPVARLDQATETWESKERHILAEFRTRTFAPTPQERDRALRDLSLRDDAIAKADATLQPLYLSVMKRLGVDVPKAASRLLQQTTKDFIEPE